MAKGILRKCGSATRCQIANLLVPDYHKKAWCWEPQDLLLLTASGTYLPGALMAKTA